MTEESLDLMDERRSVKSRNTDDYRILNKQIKVKCTEAKENWWNDQCAEVERNPPTAHRQLKNMVKSRSHHGLLFDMLQDVDIDGKDLCMMRNLYWEQTAAGK